MVWLIPLLSGCGRTPAPEALAPAPPPPLPAFVAPSADRAECTLDQVPGPLLEGRSGVTMAQGPGWRTETLDLDGATVRLSQGGCVHYGVMLEVPMAAAPTDLRAVALEVLGRLGGDTILHQSFAASPQPLPADGFACGDAWCSVGVTAMDRGHLVTVGYDFPL